MQFTTLTTDFGTQDYYVGALKGALLRRSPALHLVDISHDITPFDIVRGAFVLANVWQKLTLSYVRITKLSMTCVLGGRV